MADNFKVTKHEGSERIDEFGREHSDKLQSLGKQLISSLYMLVRSVKLYDPENSIFAKPLDVLKDTINTIIAADNQLVLQAMKESFYLNNMLVKTDFNSLDNVRALVAEFQEKGVGGFVLQHPIKLEELRDFIWIFSANNDDDAEEDGVSGRKLVNIKVSKWKKIKEKLKEDTEDAVDRKKYAVTVYARAIFYMRIYMDRMREGKSLSLRTADRFVQDLQELQYWVRAREPGQANRFIGRLSTTRVGEQEDAVRVDEVEDVLSCARGIDPTQCDGDHFGPAGLDGPSHRSSRGELAGAEEEAAAEFAATDSKLVGHQNSRKCAIRAPAGRFPNTH